MKPKRHFIHLTNSLFYQSSVLPMKPKRHFIYCYVISLIPCVRCFTDGNSQTNNPKRIITSQELLDDPLDGWALRFIKSHRGFVVVVVVKGSLLKLKPQVFMCYYRCETACVYPWWCRITPFYIDINMTERGKNSSTWSLFLLLSLYWEIFLEVQVGRCRNTEKAWMGVFVLHKNDRATYSSEILHKFKRNRRKKDKQKFMRENIHLYFVGSHSNCNIFFIKVHHSFVVRFHTYHTTALLQMQYQKYNSIFSHSVTFKSKKEEDQKKREKRSNQPTAHKQRENKQTFEMSSIDTPDTLYMVAYYYAYAGCPESGQRALFQHKAPSFYFNTHTNFYVLVNRLKFVVWFEFSFFSNSTIF